MAEAKGTTRLLTGKISPADLQKDLERYYQEAVNDGSSAVKIVPANWVEVDERVRLKCAIPRCFFYGGCASCPPYAPETQLLRTAFSKYSWAIVIKNDVIPSSDMSDQEMLKQGAHIKHYAKTARTVAKIETMAFADGHYLALGLAAGCCKVYLCRNTICQVLDSGKCRHPLKARPSMESSSIDVFGLVARLGWEGYPVYATVDPATVPLAMTVGLVFIS